MQQMTRIKKFLLTDDDRDDREMFSEALASIAPDVVYHWAEDGRHALQLLANNDKPDILFLDINMPVMNGWELLHKLKKDNNYNDIPVIIYTTSSEQRDKEIAKDLGALCFVTKPDNFRLMKSILKVVVENLDKNSLDAVCADIENILHQQ
jgi:CheY-like chemotaxis protein